MHKTTITGNLPEGENPQEFVIPAQPHVGGGPCKNLQDLVDEGAIAPGDNISFVNWGRREITLCTFEADSTVDGSELPGLRPACSDERALLSNNTLRDYQRRGVAEALASPRLRIDSIMRESMSQSVRENLSLDSVAACDLVASEFEAKHGDLAPGSVLYSAFIQAVATRRNHLAYDVWRETQALHSFGDGNRQLAVMWQSKFERRIRRLIKACDLVANDDYSTTIKERRRKLIAHSAKWLARWKESRNGF